MDTLVRCNRGCTLQFLTVWALSSAGIIDEVSVQVDHLAKQDVNDPYYIALIAATFYNMKRTDEARKLASRLVKYQKVTSF